MVDLTKCQIRMANLTKPWSSWWTFGIFKQMFGLSHGQKGQFSHMSQSKVTCSFHALGL